LVEQEDQAITLAGFALAISNTHAARGADGAYCKLWQNG
jgi:hypothetical protein